MSSRLLIFILLIMTCATLTLLKISRVLSYGAEFRKETGLSLLETPEQIKDNRHETGFENKKLEVLKNEIEDEIEVLQKTEESIARMLRQSESDHKNHIIDEDGTIIIELDAAP